MDLDQYTFEDIDLTGENKDSIAGKDEDTDLMFLKTSRAFFDRYKADRDAHETIWEVQDYMYKGGINASIMASEQSRGANLKDPLSLDEEPTRSRLGSTLFHRLVNTQSAQYMAVHLTRGTPFQYAPIVNQKVPGSDQEGLPESEVYNLYAKWVLKRNNDGVTTSDFAHHLYKTGNVIEMVYWKKVKIGNQTFGFPCFQMVPLKNVFGDVNKCGLENQHCVLACTPVTVGEIVKMVKEKEWSAEQVKKLKYRHMWDGQEGHDKDNQRTSQGLDSSSWPSETGFFLRWDVFMLAPIEDGKWDTANIPVYWWGTILGNHPDETDGILVRLERNVDPDDEIPMHLTPARTPDDSSLYCASQAETLRADYSAICTLKRQIVDEGTDSLLAPDIIDVSRFGSQKNFRHDGGVWSCDGDTRDAVTRAPSGNASQFAIQLLEYLSNDMLRGANMDPNFTGESFGARTSASEANNIFRSSAQPILAQIRYAMTHRETWRAKKILSYSGKFADKKTLFAITDDIGTVQNLELSRDMDRAFDIEVNIVDEFEDSLLRQQALNEMLAIIGQVPEFLQKVDLDELLRQMFMAKRLPATRLVLPPSDFDAEGVADFENSMFAEGQYTSPIQGQNHRAHIARHRGFIVRFQGINQYERAVDLAKQHIEEHNLFETQARAPAPRGQRNQTEGEAQGNAIAGAQGALVPQ